MPWSRDVFNADGVRGSGREGGQVLEAGHCRHTAGARGRKLLTFMSHAYVLCVAQEWLRFAYHMHTLCQRAQARNLSRFECQRLMGQPPKQYGRRMHVPWRVPRDRRAGKEADAAGVLSGC